VLSDHSIRVPHLRCSFIAPKVGWKRRAIQLLIAAAVLRACAIILTAQTAPNWTRAVQAASTASPDARILVLDLHDGHLLASHHLDDAARTLAAPGSTLKPLILYKLIASNRWSSDRRIACNRSLVISGRRLACSHPPAPPFDARSALAWSCNTYFVQAARALYPGDLGPLLRPTGLLGASGLARDEAVAEFREPRTVEGRQLAVLGIEDIRITPLELAVAYRWLATEFSAHTDGPAARTVSAALADSTESGMAQPASQGSVSVSGKTGTAESPASQRTHGWFAGFAPAAHPEIVIVVFLPTGRGMDAAHVAGLVLAEAPLTANKAKHP